MSDLSPDAVMAQIAAALPDDCRQNVIIVGSLAAGYHFFAGDESTILLPIRSILESLRNIFPTSSAKAMHRPPCRASA